MSLINAGGAKPPYMLAAEQFQRNREQLLAYDSTGHCVILAGPGSGKTKTLTIKLARMLAEDVPPPRGIACITYNKECARELKKRLSALGVENGRRVSIGTLHSFCLHHIILPYAHLTKQKINSPVAVASTEEISRFQKQALDGYQMFRGWEPSIDKYRRTHLDRTSNEWRTDDGDTAEVIERYEALLFNAGLIDFDAMVLLGLNLVKKYEWIRKALAARFPILVVDEYQDLGHALHQIVLHLCFKAGMRLLAVGDPDQSIYDFTGAEPRLLRDLSSRDDVAKVTLKLNYRCGQSIITASEAALGEERGYRSGRAEPGEIFFHERADGIEDQAKYICEELIPDVLGRDKKRQLGDIAILYIDKNDGNVIAKEVSSRGWKYIRVDANNPYQASPVTYWLEDCAAWCAGAWRTGDVRLSELISRWLSFNERLVGEKERREARIELVKFLMSHREPDMLLFEWLSLLFQEMLKASLEHEPRLRDDKKKVENLISQSSRDGALKDFTVAYFGGQGGAPDHLRLSTLHSAKGLEYDVVIMFGMEDGRIPWSTDSELAIKNKRRLFYVGLTRTRFEVHLIFSGWYRAPNGRCYTNGKSRFVDEVQTRLKI